MAFDPTPEQQTITEAFEDGSHLVIEAGAGSGKTSTLRLMAETAPGRKGLYVAYNKAIQMDAAGSFPSNVLCKTAHSLAFGAIGREYAHRLKVRMTFKDQARLMGINAPFPITDEVSLSPSQLVSVVKQAVSNFCNSADAEILPHHIWKVDGAEDNMGKLRAHVLPIAQRVWEDARDKSGKLPFTHDYYLKMWALTDPNLHVSFVLYDEAQDANPCIAGVVLGQRAYGSQVVLVGDSAQAIYGWRGAVNAMSDFAAVSDVETLVLSQSFRFGDAVAVEANKWLDLLDAPLRLRGFDKIPSRVETLTNPDAILCRTNAECIAQALAHQETGRKVAIVGGTKEIKKMAEAAIDLMNGKQPFHPEFAAFKTWDAFVQYVEEDGEGSLKVFVRLITNYGADRIIQVCDASVNEKRADIVVSTVHKAKGREWDHVQIASDFREPNREEGQEINRAEAMLAYVAVTRAKKVLDNYGLAWVDAWVGQGA